MTDASILDRSVKASPKQFTVSGSQEIQLKSVTASFDGTGAAGSFVPCVQILDPSGFTVGSYPIGFSLAAGASADVSWFPGLGATAGNLVKLFDTILSVDTASFDFQSIPQGYSALWIVTYLRSTFASVGGGGNLLVNNLETPAIGYELADSTGFTQTPGSGPAWEATGANADAHHFASGSYIWPDYSVSQTDHTMTGHSGKIGQTADTTTWVTKTLVYQACYSAAIQITRLTYNAPSGKNWVAGSRVTIYGMA